jgi:hypothetical protein
MEVKGCQWGEYSFGWCVCYSVGVFGGGGPGEERDRLNLKVALVLAADALGEGRYSGL